MKSSITNRWYLVLMIGWTSIVFSHDIIKVFHLPSNHWLALNYFHYSFSIFMELLILFFIAKEHRKLSIMIRILSIYNLIPGLLLVIIADYLYYSSDSRYLIVNFLVRRGIFICVQLVAYVLLWIGSNKYIITEPKISN